MALPAEFDAVDVAGDLRDPAVPVAAFDVSSVDTYLLARRVAELFDGTSPLWCPLSGVPSDLDRDTARARRIAETMCLPLVFSARHPSPAPRMMRIAALASGRGCAWQFMFRVANLAFASGVDLEVLGSKVKLGAKNLDEADRYDFELDPNAPHDPALLLAAGEPGSPWDEVLGWLSAELSAVGFHSAPAIRWHGEIVVGFDAILGSLADAGYASAGVVASSVSRA